MGPGKDSRVLCLLVALLSMGQQATGAGKYDILPSANTSEFRGTIGQRTNESQSYWPPSVAPPAGSPNIFMILIDDAGYGATSTFGGPIPTPTFDAIANKGLRYTKFHTTALCSPTRAALLTGRNHHSVHSGIITELSTGYPGYDTLMGRDTASLGEILKLSGYNTMWTGKMHNVPDWMSSSSGPFDLWPTGLGFEAFYGFLGGEADQYRPAMFEGTTPIEPYMGKADYTLNSDMANYTISYIEKRAALSPSKPWLVYYAPGATHAPHQVPKKWIEPFKGKFDHGWDKQREVTFQKQLEMGVIPPGSNLTVRPEHIPAWDKASKEEKEVYARMMEVYAGFMAQTDYEIGRVLERIKSLGQEDNTMVVLMLGDNGASAEGTLTGQANMFTGFNTIGENITFLHKNMDLLGSDQTFNHYPVGWAHAMNTPFQWTKQIASHYGGTRNPLVISWPAKVKKEAQGGLRHQWHHVIDIAPTILEAVGIDPPSLVNGVTQRRFEGTSMLYTFQNDTAPSTRETQYFEILGNQGIYDKGWIASTSPPSLPWLVDASPKDLINGVTWELYNVEKDPTQSYNLAAENPAKLKEMRDLFYHEASTYNVFPLDDSKIDRVSQSVRPSLLRGRKQITFFKGMTRVTQGAAPDLKNKDFNITADVTLHSDKEHGVLATNGGKFAGWVFYMREGKLVYHFNWAGVERYEVVSDNKVGKGDHKLGLVFDWDGTGRNAGGLATLYVDGAKVGSGRINKTLSFRASLDESFDVGEDTGTAAAPDYEVPNAFTGVFKSITFDI